MRIATLTLIGALGFAASAVSASAAPIAPLPAAPQAANIIEIAGGCGWGAHPNRWGRCVPNHGFYRPYAYYRPHWRGYYGGGYGPWWGSPSDHVANQLNRQQLYGY